MTGQDIYSDFDPERNECDESIPHSQPNTPKRWNGYSGGWSAESIWLLRSLWAEGWSASIIGGRLGRTRNAILGKRWRLGLPGRRSGHSAHYSKCLKRKAPAMSKPRAPKVSTPKPRPIPKAPDSNPCSIMELDSHRCRWITGDPKQPFDPIYCGGKTAEGSSYCELHRHASTSGGEGRSPADLATARHKPGRFTVSGFKDDALEAIA